MKDRNRRAICIISLLVLCAGFVLIRFAMFDIHGMKQWPLVLFVGVLVVIGVSYFAGAGLIPPFTAVSYIMGFTIGKIFQQDGTDPGGGSTNNLWIIWTVIFVCFTLASILTELLAVRKKR